MKLSHNERKLHIPVFELITFLPSALKPEFIQYHKTIFQNWLKRYYEKTIMKEEFNLPGY